ncbi:hypothetical protein U1Q18_003709 [Sarracenia purpurea var. burkii]
MAVSSQIQSLSGSVKFEARAKTTSSFRVGDEVDSLLLLRIRLLPLEVSMTMTSSTAVSTCTGFGRNLVPVWEALNEIPVAVSSQIQSLSGSV